MVKLCTRGVLKPILRGRPLVSGGIRYPPWPWTRSTAIILSLYPRIPTAPALCTCAPRNYFNRPRPYLSTAARPIIGSRVYWKSRDGDTNVNRASAISVPRQANCFPASTRGRKGWWSRRYIRTFFFSTRRGRLLTGG